MEDLNLLNTQSKNKKAKTHKGKLHLKTFLPKIVEDPKGGLFINTKNSSEIMRMVLTDLVKIICFYFSI
jgi:hypothetical protein